VKIVHVFVVLSTGTSWGCVYEYGEDIIEKCANETSTWMTTTSVANKDTCRWSTLLFV